MSDEYERKPATTRARRDVWSGRSDCHVCRASLTFAALPFALVHWGRVPFTSAARIQVKAMRVAVPALCVALTAPAAVNAQTGLPLSVEGRVGLGAPTGDFGDGGKAGVGFGATATYQLMPLVGIRAGFNYQRFGVDDSQFDEFEEEFGDVSADFTDSGFALGLALTPSLTPSLNLIFHADAIMHQLKASGSIAGESVSNTSGRKVGFDVGAGVEFPVAPRASVLPRVRYRRYGLEDGNVTYFAADVGFKIRF